MGALRAAETRAHGMIGIGQIFEWYASGEIEGDDEVAQIFGALDEKLLAEASQTGLTEGQ